MHQPFTVVALCAIATTACAPLYRTAAAGGGCADAAASPDLQTAFNALTLPGALGDRLRGLVGPPFHVDSLRARVRPVVDDAICRAAGRSAQIWRASDRYLVFALGGTYWVRGTEWGGVNVLDAQFRRLDTFVDQ
jgi:hypothetical protein